MFHSDCILLGDHPVPWDTGSARHFLMITDEERRILDNIPGWSVVEIEKRDKHISEGETSSLVVERPLTQLHIADARSDIADAGSDIAEAGSDIADAGSDIADAGSDIADARSDIAEAGSDIAEAGSDIADAGSDIVDAESTNTYNTPNPNSDNLAKVSARNCDLPWKENSTITLSEEKHSFMQSISLYANKVVDRFSSIPRRKRSNSLSDMHLAKLDASLPFSKSETSLNGGACSHQTSNFVKKVTCEKLDTPILNYPFLNYTLLSTEGEYDNRFLLQKSMQDTRKKLLNKRLELLEKRFSPSGENGLLWPSEGIATSKFDLGFVTNQNLTCTSVCLPDLVCDNHLINSSNAVLGTNSPLGVCPYSSVKMNKLNTIMFESQKLIMSIAKSAEKVSKAEPSFPSKDFCCGEKGAKPTNNVLSTVHNEESLPLIPRPEKSMQKEQISVVVQSTQPILNPLIDCYVSQNCRMPGVSESCDITPVESCALQPYETPSSLNTPFIQSNSMNQIMTNSEMHPKNDYFSKTIVAVTENGHSNVFSENCTGHDVMKNSASGKLGGKRKRQHKDNRKPRKKTTNSLVRIQYAADHVRNMIQIMKKFRSEM